MEPRLESSGGKQRRVHGGSVVAGDRSAQCFRAAWNAAKERREPFRHWLIADVLPPDAARAVLDLPILPAPIADTKGKRETHNALRVFFSGKNLEDYPVCSEIASAFQQPRIVSAIAEKTGQSLAGSFLRIEYCQDTSGFYLEPHTDVGAKLVTMMIHLSTGQGAENWGTDLYRMDGTHAGRVRSAFNSAYMFLPGTDTLHGFEPREIAGVRRALIVNYVKPEWRSRHELAFPDLPVG